MEVRQALVPRDGIPRSEGRITSLGREQDNKPGEREKEA